MVQNCSTENVCAVCEKYDVYAENDFLGIFPCRHCPHGKIPKNAHWATIVAKKRDPGILDHELLLAQISKVEARLVKLAKIRKVESD